MRTRALKACLLISSLAVALGLSEVLVRLLLPAPQFVRVEPAPDFAERLQRENSQQSRLSLARRTGEGGLFVKTSAGRRLRSNTLAVIENHYLSGRQIEIRTNSLGYRNRELARKRGTRILFLGDSITLSGYLCEEETFVRLVESQAREMGRNWETINAGVGAISLENELAILMETGLALEPDVVVVGFYLNDFSESPGVYVMPLPKFLERSRLLQYLSKSFASDRSPPSTMRQSQRRADYNRWLADFDRQWPSSQGDYRNDKTAFNRLIRENLRDWGGAWSDHAWSRMTPLIAEFRRLSLEYDFELYLLAFPVVYQVHADYVYDHPQQRLKTVAEALDIRVLDLLPELRRQHRRVQVPLFYDQCHHTPAGAAIVADSIHAFLGRSIAPARRPGSGSAGSGRK